MMEYDIDESFIRKIYLVLNSNGYFDSDNYDVEIIFQEAEKFSTKIVRPSANKRELIIKYPKKNTDKAFYNRLEKYLRTECGFDLWLYSYRNDISMIEVYTIFSILHEFGHVIEYIDRINHGGDYLNRDEMIELSKYWEVSRIENLDERFIAYRKIDKEHIADEIAIKLMREHKKELKLIV